MEEAVGACWRREGRLQGDFTAAPSSTRGVLIKRKRNNLTPSDDDWTRENGFKLREEI